jgi:hypothetical protein
LRGVTPPPRPIDRCRCIGRKVRNRSGIIRSSQRTGDDPTDDRRCPPTTTTSPTAVVVTTAAPTTTAMMTLRLRYAGGANHDSRAQSDDSFFHWVNISLSRPNTMLTSDLYLISAEKILVLQINLGVGILRDLVMGDAEFVRHFASHFSANSEPLVRQFIPGRATDFESRDDCLPNIPRSADTRRRRR